MSTRKNTNTAKIIIQARDNFKTYIFIKYILLSIRLLLKNCYSEINNLNKNLNIPIKQCITVIKDYLYSNKVWRAVLSCVRGSGQDKFHQATAFHWRSLITRGRGEWPCRYWMCLKSFWQSPFFRIENQFTDWLYSKLV